MATKNGLQWLIALLLAASLSHPASGDEGTADTDDLGILANSICDRVLLAVDMGGKVLPHEIFENAILYHLGLTKESPGYQDAIVAFWNDNIDEMVCTAKTLGYQYPQHLLNRIVSMDAISHMYFKYLLPHPFDMNSVLYMDCRDHGPHNVWTCVEGKPETLLDHLDALIADPEMRKIHNIKEVKQLRAFILRYRNAMTAEEYLSQQ